MKQDQGASSGEGRAVADEYLTNRKSFNPTSYEGKPRFLSKTDKRVLRAFTTPIWKRLDKLDEDGLRALIRACLNVSRINCGWDEYAIAKMICDLAQFRLKDRLAERAIKARNADAPKDQSPPYRGGRQ